MPENKNPKFSDAFRDIHLEIERCPKLANNHGMLATGVIDKQN